MCTGVNATPVPPPATSRRGFLFTLGLALNAVAAWIAEAETIPQTLS